MHSWHITFFCQRVGISKLRPSLKVLYIESLLDISLELKTGEKFLKLLSLVDGSWEVDKDPTTDFWLHKRLNILFNLSWTLCSSSALFALSGICRRLVTIL
jgi:hypothetical protein